MLNNVNTTNKIAENIVILHQIWNKCAPTSITVFEELQFQ